MFKKVEPKPDFPKIEHQILDFWKKNQCFQKLQKKLAGHKHWSFIDGPITANNPMGVHHAWGRTYKDVFQRFKAMQGYDQRWQNGFDCQGLWVEVEEEKDLGFKSKKDILNFGLDKFSKACRARVDKYSKVITKQSKRLGQWMDWENSYYTMSDTNIQYIWYFLKKCQEKGWLYKGSQVMPWCTRCGTSLSQHELADVYKEVAHDAVYIKLPIKGKRNEYLLVWTTTPWTLTSNTACAVHPDLVYIRVKLAADASLLRRAPSRFAIRRQAARLSEQVEQHLVLAKARLDVLEGTDYKIVEKFKGKDLVGLEYSGPFDELPVQKGVVHKVIPWQEVTTTEGTGIVHLAPGCGEEDHKLGKEFKLTEIAPLDEFGIFLEGFGNLTGKDVHQVKDLIYQNLKQKEYFYKSEKYKHRYPYCWRCGQELVFRLVEEWFIRSDEIRSPMKREAKKVKWIPEYVEKRMQDWLDNMQDWCISRKRFWGLPLPFYPCSCGHLEVVASKKELIEKVTKIQNVKIKNQNYNEKFRIFERCVPELHRPWIDEVQIECPKCGKEVSRILEVGDCWLDAGIVPFSTLKYFEDKKYWKKWFPAQLVVEMREQVRLWFYALLFMSVTLENKTPYKTVFSYERVCDEKGRPMHRALGNVIWFDQATEKMGADVMRWMYCAASPAFDLRFGYKKAEEIKRKLILFWNIYLFFVNYAVIENFKPSHKLNSSHVLDQWILSNLNDLILKVTDRLENYDPAEVIRLSEKFLDDLSTWYVRRSRKRFWKTQDKEDQRQAFETLYEVLMKFCKLLAPILPFVTEEIYQNLILSGVEGSKPISIHLSDWPKANKKLINKELNEKMQLIRDVVTLGQALRIENKIKVKQPLLKLEIRSEKLEVKKDQDLLDLIKDELNLKEVLLVKKINKGLKIKKEKGLEIGLDIKITPKLKQEGLAREFVRHLQDMRKQAKYSLSDQIVTYFQTEDKKIERVISNFGNYIKQETLSLEIKSGKEKVDKEKEVQINKIKVWLGVKK